VQQIHLGLSCLQLMHFYKHMFHILLLRAFMVSRQFLRQN
jgi:hypothetical protein